MIGGMNLSPSEIEELRLLADASGWRTNDPFEAGWHDRAYLVAMGLAYSVQDSLADPIMHRITEKGRQALANYRPQPERPATHVAILRTACGAEHRPMVVQGWFPQPDGISVCILPARNEAERDPGVLPDYVTRKFVWRGKKRGAERGEDTYIYQEEL